MLSPRRLRAFVLHDVLLIAVSIAVAVLLVRTGTLERFLASFGPEGYLLGSFIAGLFFTSVFTTAPAIAALGELTNLYPILPVAILGALGAMVGDVVIFRFIRDEFAEHVLELVGHRSFSRRVHSLFRLRLVRFLSFFVGGVIIASPLPDELGLGMLGLSHVRMSWFLPLSFTFNCIGILLIGLVVGG